MHRGDGLGGQLPQALRQSIAARVERRQRIAIATLAGRIGRPRNSGTRAASIDPGGPADATPRRVPTDSDLRRRSRRSPAGKGRARAPPRNSTAAAGCSGVLCLSRTSGAENIRIRLKRLLT